MNRTPIYLDYAAATPMDEAAVTAMNPYLTKQFYNPSAVYEPARSVRRNLEEARATVASVLGCKDQEVLFTAGGTEANNIAIHGVLSQYPKANIVVSSIEHESVLEPANKYQRIITPVNSKGIVDLLALKQSINNQTVLVSVMYANNEVGTVQPLKEIAAYLQTVKQLRRENGNKLPIYLHTDACQAANYLDLQTSRLGVDMMTLNGSKIYAAKQSGCLYVSASVELTTFIQGGGQERKIRSGTENVPSQIAFATMLQKVQTNRKVEGQRLQQIRDIFIATMLQKNSDISINGDLKRRLPNNAHLTVPGADGERLLMELDEAGVLVATSSACTASSNEPSHVLLALGLSISDANASLRITFGAPTTTEDAEEAARRIISVIQTHTRLV